ARGVLARHRFARPRPRRGVGTRAPGVRRPARRCSPVRDPVDRRAILAQERSLCGRLAAARVPEFRPASRRTHRHRGPLDRVAADAADSDTLAASKTMRRTLFSRPGLALVGLLLCVTVRADGALHSLWELHGKHNTVYLLGSIHVLRLKDYPLAPVVLEAYGKAKSLVMEVNLEEISSEQLQ